MHEDCLFVYGTLRPACAHPMSEWLAARSDWLGTARVPGALYYADGYPIWQPRDSESGWVLGDVVRLLDPASVWPRLDQYEGCGGEKPEYERLPTTIHWPEDADPGLPSQVWAYHGRPELLWLINERRIEGGDFLAFKPQT